MSQSTLLSGGTANSGNTHSAGESGNAAAATQPPPALPADVELAKLRERLRVSDEWNVRLQNQIQELLRLPRNEVEAMRERMQSPEIAIPLLQCYDAAIQEKAEENVQLRKENTRLQAAAELRAGEHIDLGNAVRVAEELAARVQKAAQEETTRAQAALREAQTECAQLRQELARALDAESESKRSAERLSKQMATLRAEKDAIEADKMRLEEAARIAALHQRQLRSTEGESLAQQEAQRVRLAVVTRENEERLEELERLRARMVQALRQAADNHAAHMKVVEERHRLVVEQLRTSLHTQEMEIRRMRGQLAWADPNATGGGGSSLRSGGSNGGDGLLTSTKQLVEAQTRQAQELEIKRLYNDLAQVQTQRDDAVLRYEQLTATLRRDRQQRELERQREAALLLQAKESEQQRVRHLEEELEAARKAAAQQRDNHRRSQEALQQLRDDKEAALLQAQEATVKEAATATRLADCEERLARVEAAEKERAAALEQRVNATLADMQAAKARAYAECERLTQERDEARRQRQHVEEQLAAAQRLVGEAQRERQIAQTQVGRLTEALEMHKKQLAACDEKLVAMQAQLNAAGQQSRSAQLAMERLRLENAKLARWRGVPA